MASDVIEAIVDATTPGKKAKARRMLNKYIEQQRAAGHRDDRTLAAIKAVITRHYGGNDNGMLGCLSKDELLRRAKAGCRRPAKVPFGTDRQFTATIRRLRPDWFAE